jgi:hypothetical protein
MRSVTAESHDDRKKSSSSCDSGVASVLITSNSSSTDGMARNVAGSSLSLYSASYNAEERHIPEGDYFKVDTARWLYG